MAETAQTALFKGQFIKVKRDFFRKRYTVIEPAFDCDFVHGDYGELFDANTVAQRLDNQRIQEAQTKGRDLFS